MDNTLSKIDLKMIMQGNFKPLVNQDGEIAYGWKSISVSQYIIGLIKTVQRDNGKNKITNKFRTKYKLKNGEMHLSDGYKHIAEKFNCSISLVKNIVKQLCDYGIIKHFRKAMTNIWVFIFVDNEPNCLRFFKTKRIQKSAKFEKIYNDTVLKKPEDDMFSPENLARLAAKWG